MSRAALQPTVAKPQPAQPDSWWRRHGAGASSLTGETGADSIPADAHAVLRSPGQPLDAATQAFFEPRFGHDFSQVRVHADAPAADSALALNAQAYTVGRHVVFAAGQFAPHSSAGARLLAHELTHVVQQHGGALTEPLTLGPAEDSYEREADAAAEQALAGGPTAPITPVGDARVQGSFLSTLGDIVAFPFVAIYRLLGGESYHRETLETYLRGLKERGAIEDHYDSDNKARACVKRESELGPYDVAIKTLLVREMLEGATLWGDEAAIIALLRRAQPGERSQIVAGIGRDRIWGDFSGRNRRIIEAITLTSADAGDALVTRFRAMPADDLQDYVNNALDPTVRAAAQKAAMLQRITAPVPVTATVSPQGVASFQINGVDVVAEPDSASNDEKYRNRAFTAFGLIMDRTATVTIDATTNVAQSFTPPHLLAKVQTTFGPGYDPSGASGYGRGTTPEDTAAGSTTLRFHESRHAADWFDFLRDNPPPAFKGQAGMSMSDFQKAQDQLEKDIQAYNRRASEYSVRKTDCPGHPPTEAELAPFGLTTAICRQQ